jgi:hypothetical protein
VRARQIGDGRIEIAVGRCLQRPRDPVLELLGRDPALGRGAVQTTDGVVTVGI